MTASPSSSAAPSRGPEVRSESGTVIADRPGAVIAGRFRLGSRVDRSSRLPVWSAFDERLNRQVAFKRLTGDSRGSDEADRPAVATISSPHVVRLYDVGRDELGGFAVMELVSGPTLEALLEDGPLPWKVVAAIGCQTARGLAAFHRQGLVRGELRLGDVLISDPAGFVKLTPLRSSSLTTAPLPAAAEETRYLPLDVALGRLGSASSPARDLVPLGLILRDCLAGVAAHGAGAPSDPRGRARFAVAATIDAFGPDVPVALVSLVDALLCGPGDGHAPDAASVAHALQELVGSRPSGVIADHLRQARSTTEVTRPLPAADRRSDDPSQERGHEEHALRLAAMAFTQAVTAGCDPQALATAAGDRPDVLDRAREVLSAVSQEDDHHHRLAGELLTAAHLPAGDIEARAAPVDEQVHLDVVRASGLLDSPAEEAFDRVSRLATRVLGTPVSLVSIVDGDRQFFKSQIGLPEPWASARQTPISHSFCRYVTESGHPLAITDAHRHPLVAENGAVADIGVVAYLGVPVRDLHGTVLGSFCVISDEARQWTPQDMAVLEELAAIVQREIRIREAAKELAREAASAREAMASLAHDLRAPLGVVAGGVETIRRLQPDAPAGVNTLLDAIGRQANRTIAIACAILESERPVEDGDGFGFRTMIEQLVQDGVLPTSAQARMRVAIPPGLRSKVNRVLLEQIVVNLIGNALQHTDGDVEVDARRVPGGWIELRVLDQGPGLSRDQLASLVRPHVRGGSSEGYGLGLALVRRFADQLGGALDVDERSDAPGAAVVVTLPDNDDSAPVEGDSFGGGDRIRTDGSLAGGKGRTR